MQGSEACPGCELFDVMDEDQGEGCVGEGPRALFQGHWGELATPAGLTHPVCSDLFTSASQGWLNKW